MNSFFKLVKLSIVRRFNLQDGRADEDTTVAGLRKDSAFRGANLWTLIFAIFIASIGLNVNSTAVIIGAMLISPLMGPIMGIGLGIAINDFELVKKGLRNLLVATVVSICTSSLYFLITPLSDAQSELLARTTPSLWDVFIAFFGGLAGVVGTTRKEKTNVIPGVAIATALMPPLCTAGYGLANANMAYFFGAIYLFFINGVFICISTFLIFRLMNYERISFENKAVEKKVSRYILIIVIITVLPSIYFAYNIVQKSIFESNARHFVNKELAFQNTQVINRNFRYDRKGSVIDLLLIGYELPSSTIDSLKKSLKNYRLFNTQLIIRQGLDARQEIDFSQIRASIMEDVFRQDSAHKIIEQQASEKETRPDLQPEIKALFPEINSYNISDVVTKDLVNNRADSITQLVAFCKRPYGKANQQKMEKWLKVRLNKDSVRLIIVNQ